MSKTVIKCGLGTSEITRAIKEVKKFKKDFLKKVDTYRKRIAEEIAVQASANFGSAVMDDVIDGSPRRPDVAVSVSDNGSITVVVANGEDAVWCEFGAGVYHNGSVGSSPHPKGNDLGFTIGSYDKGYGKKKVWGYYDDAGDLVLTHGTPASMPMYNAAQDVLRKAVSIAREVWG